MSTVPSYRYKEWVSLIVSSLTNLGVYKGTVWEWFHSPFNIRHGEVSKQLRYLKLELKKIDTEGYNTMLLLNEDTIVEELNLWNEMIPRRE